jgi:hypothetical protein
MCYVPRHHIEQNIETLVHKGSILIASFLLELGRSFLLLAAVFLCSLLP